MITNFQGQFIKIIENPDQQIIKLATKNYASGLYFVEILFCILQF